MRLTLAKREAQTRTTELLLELEEYVFSDKTLNDIDFARIKKEVSNLPTRQERSLVEVMAYCATSNVEEAKNKALSVAREYSDQPEVTSNLLGPMVYIGKPTVAYEIIQQMPFERIDRLVVQSIFSVNFMFNDFEIEDKLDLWLKKTDQWKFFTSERADIYKRRELVKEIQSRFNVSPYTITELSLLAASIVENHCGIRINKTQLAIPPASMNATLIIYVECEPEHIFELNWDLSGALVEQDLDEVKCITHFELLEGKFPTLESRISSHAS